MGADDVPNDNPIRSFYEERDPSAVPEWTDELPWGTVVRFDAVDGASPEDRFATAQAAIVKKGGGVIYFPPGLYEFSEDLVLEDNVILRGANQDPAREARDQRFEPPTRFEFPKYQPSMEGSGTPIDTAFKAIRVKNPATASRCGVVNISVNRGHIHFQDGPEHAAGGERFVFGCKLTNTAAADPTIPNTKYRQAPHQRFTARHRAAIDLYSGDNVFVANNRIPESGDDNFVVKPYSLVKVNGKSQDFRIDDPKGVDFEYITLEEGVEFDYDNRPGIYVNHYAAGLPGRQLPNGTPETFPQSFRKGIVIRDNFIFCSGRSAITFSGDGTYAAYNTIRYSEGEYRPTTTGLVTSDGSATNDSRAMTIRGYRWHVHGNDFLVYHGKTYSGDRINDGEGLMHESHHNSIVLDSRMTDNVGNQYICLWRVHIDGLLIKGNKIADKDDPAINIFCPERDVKNLEIVGNEITEGTIRLTMETAENIAVRDNRYVGSGEGKIIVDDPAWVGAGNQGFVVEEEPSEKTP